MSPSLFSNTLVFTIPRRDMLWRYDQILKTHPNGMRFSAFGADGDLLATNEYFRYVLILIPHVSLPIPPPLASEAVSS